MSTDDRKRLLALRERAAERLVRQLLDDELPPGHHPATYSFSRANTAPKVPGSPKSIAQVPPASDQDRLGRARSQAAYNAGRSTSNLEQLMSEVGIQSSSHAGNDGDYLQLKKWEEVHQKSGIEDMVEFVEAVLSSISDVNSGFPGAEGLYAYADIVGLVRFTDFDEDRGGDALFHSYCYGGSPSRMEAFIKYGSQSAEDMAHSIASSIEMASPAKAEVVTDPDGSFLVQYTPKYHRDIAEMFNFSTPGAAMWGIRVLRPGIIQVAHNLKVSTGQEDSEQPGRSTSDKIVGKINPATPE